MSKLFKGPNNFSQECIDAALFHLYLSLYDILVYMKMLLLLMISYQKGLNVFLVILIKATKPQDILIWFVVTKTSFILQVCGIGLNRQTILRFSCPLFVCKILYNQHWLYFSFTSHRRWLMDWRNVKYLFWAQKLRAISNRGI